MGRDFPFRFPHKSKRCRHFDDDGNERWAECDYSSSDCWFAHPDDPEWERCPRRRMGGKVPKGPSADLDRYTNRRRSGARSRERSRSRSRERDRGWGERGRQYRSRSRSPPRRRPDSLASSHASIVHGPTSPGHRPRESRRASINNNNASENSYSPSTSIQPFVVPSSPALSLPPRSPAQQPPPPGSPLKLFSSFQRIRPEIVTTLETANPSPTTASLSALTVPPQPPAVTTSTTTTDPTTNVHPTPPSRHSSSSPTIPGLTSSTKEPLVLEKMSVMSLEDGQVAEAPTPTVPSAIPPMPPLVPIPSLPSFEYEPTPATEVSQEDKIEMWNTRIKIFAELLTYKDRIQGLEAGIDDLTRYSTSSTFTSLNDDSEEKQHIQSNLEELLSERDTAIQDLQKGLDELAIGSASSDSTAVEWPKPLDVEEAQKKNEKVKEYVIGLADVMREVSLTLKRLEEVMDTDDDERKKRKAARRRDKGKEKEVLVDDAMDVDKEEVLTAEAVPIPSGASQLPAEGQREGTATVSEASSSSSSSSHSLEISKIRAKFEQLEISIQNVAISLEQTESTWMQGVKELFEDLVLKQKKTVRKHVGKHRQLIEQHAIQLKSSLGQVSDSVDATNAKVQSVADETTQAMEKINRLERERDALLEGHKRFFDEDLPGLKKSFKEYEMQREEDKRRMAALEAALNAFINRPPGESRNMVNGAMAMSKMSSTIVTSVATATSSEGVPNSNLAKTVQTPTLTTPTLHPPTPPVSSSSLQQSFFPPLTVPVPSSSSSTLAPPPTPSSSNDASYLLQNIKPTLILLLRETVKPLLQEIRQKVEEMVSAQKEEMYMTVWSSMQFTWQILGKIEKRAEVDFLDILNKAGTAAPTAARVGMSGGGGNVRGEKTGGSRANGDVSMDGDPNVNASSTAAGPPPTSAMGGCGKSLTNGNGTVVPIAGPGFVGP